MSSINVGVVRSMFGRLYFTWLCIRILSLLHWPVTNLSALRVADINVRREYHCNSTIKHTCTETEIYNNKMNKLLF